MKLYLSILLCVVALIGCSHSEDRTPSKNQAVHPPAQEENQGDQSNTGKEHLSLTVQEIVSLAKTGHVVNNPFAAHQSTILQVKNAWGEPEQVDQVENRYYATYPAKHAVFGYTEDGQIEDVRSYDPSIQVFTFTEIKQYMEDPTRVTTNGNEKIIMYKLNEDYQLKWILSNQSGKVDHLAVYSLTEQTITDEAYLLSIKGNSKNLSASAWEKMRQWRKEILDFPKRFPDDVYVNGPDKKRVALTFDDGPDRINTPKIIDALREENVRGTFFFIGQKVQQNPDIVKAAYDNGNIIGSHSFYHRELTKETEAELREDLLKSSEAIRAVIGQSPALLRPPYGDMNDKVISVAKEQDSIILIWSIDTLDWSQKEQANIKKNVLDNVRNGDIILMHSDDDKTETAKAVPTIIKQLKARGFEIVDAATLLNTDPYK
ncbi:polysaccharide deacetylase family protein [Bacillus sp. FJAT-29814]|uniref:polysaccharide deacetylase family protein n=1 Tax=Bacillus sp. FJAT-29814 TaxID=1729688 RepID=UPI00082BD885|nr:polysaccharide deacetylase family protein [Bacillus sp. FJAT-29814]